MAVLTIHFCGEVHSLSFEPGSSVRDLLESTEFRVRSGCRGNGACGLCRVRLLSGAGGPVTRSEQFHLHERRLERGERLACQMHPLDDLTIDVLNPAAPSNWHATPEGLWRRGDIPGSDVLRELPNVRHPCGLAIDVGTTNICLSVFELPEGRWFADRWGRNPQGAWGADVLTRLSAAAASEETAQEMGEAVADAIGEALQDIAVRHGLDLRRIAWITLVGNTAMLCLFTGRNYALLLRPENWTEFIDCQPADYTSWTERWSVHPEAEMEILAPLAGFVGSDLLAGIVATGLSEGIAPALFVDVGTNSEVALWDGRTLHVTAAAGGPAFESSGDFGMPAEPGAVYRVSSIEGRLDFHLLGDDRAKGVCGSGLVDLIARLREGNILTATGNFMQKQAYAFTVGGQKMLLTKRDVDAFQRAKAAIAVGTLALCREAGIHTQELRRICVAGAFGRYLDVTSGQEVGLLPPVPPERVELVGNTALAGCADVMLSSEAAERLSRLRKLPKLINLSYYPAFDDLFLENLYLRPIKDD
ncbi:ASKHA domain-containing protein [Thiohalomonas denitrificans]|uniref:ASKHA domain-containing protein n=1 Tax=Thiohalomonas denitrificans TaxID=415747 RepID=UPI0026E9C21C|nr:ASKHA domain-containing protein [Thiohalomonas denitrificans]